MVTVDAGWLKSANGLVMLINVAAAIASVTFWELHCADHNNTLSKRQDWQIYYTCAVVIAMVIVTVIFFMALCGKLTKRFVAIIFLVIAGILVLAAIIVVLCHNDRNYKTFSLMSSAVLVGGIIANVVYTGVGGLKITT